ncbi:MAG TPA: DegT/DnrJ/EryC1/StrS family aminotransferase [Pseudomonadales bacterium]|nr:DegT/DnrJ/EryC1/StrS family aminotransferase [Pseudomonadales bacterium]
MTQAPRRIALSQVYIDDEVRHAVMAALESGQYILGPQCRAFEEELAAYTGTRHAVLSSNWTSSTSLLLEAMGVQEGDEILLPSHTAFPSVEPIIHVGAKPVFVDIDDRYGINAALLEAALTPRTVGILPVHLYGTPVDLAAIMAFAAANKLWVIEDCAQAQGASYNGKRVGSFGHAAAFSFYPSKNLTVLGDGGCICTDDDELAAKIRALRNHGRVGKNKYQHDLVGYNMRFNELQAAAGRVGLRHLDALNRHRREVSAHYNRRLASLVTVPAERPAGESVYHMYVIGTARRDALAAFLAERGIETGIHYPIACHQQPAITNLFEKMYPGTLPVLPDTEKCVNSILSLPIHGQLATADVDYICDQVEAFFS